MKRRVYIETSVVSYLTARPSLSVIAAARQAATCAWWARRDRFLLLASPLVWTECSAGDPEAAAKRIEALGGITMLPSSDEDVSLAASLIGRGAFPAKATDDAFHVAVAARHGVEFLMTWNFRHIANPMIRRAIARRLRESGYELPVICTPDELLEGGDRD